MTEKLLTGTLSLNTTNQLIANDTAWDVYGRGNRVFNIRQELFLGVKSRSSAKDIWMRLSLRSQDCQDCPNISADRVIKSCHTGLRKAVWLSRRMLSRPLKFRGYAWLRPLGGRIYLVLDVHVYMRVIVWCMCSMPWQPWSSFCRQSVSGDTPNSEQSRL